MLLVLIALFIVVPLLELAVIIEIGREIGVGPTIAVLIADSVLGSLLMRAQGRAAWRRFTQATRGGRPPAREVIDGALIVAGGALLLTPGFITDVLGLALLLPPTRAVVRRILAQRLLKRMVTGMTGPAPRSGGRPGDAAPRAGGRPGGAAPGRAPDLEGTYREAEAPGRGDS
ncbi:MAG: hypothetical protein AVDCRST_MAG65-1687 [uncultured Solirubrobacteraceae bacterium]|uniref:Cytoplasmic membrane protein FsxA n=1 Tax=uncultured Solirubrobacteraceae bacterium TaxID=1162706 RepID=A0A6J4RYA5_9ACTN|nr:MAG: hypothetical protein AVDCRST_MAG65-1687 [uncultured Solirubrobacteraceae bacterium]